MYRTGDRGNTVADRIHAIANLFSDWKHNTNSFQKNHLTISIISQLLLGLCCYCRGNVVISTKISKYKINNMTRFFCQNLVFLLRYSEFQINEVEIFLQETLIVLF